MFAHISDVLLAVLLPLCLFMLGTQFLGRPTFSFRTLLDVVNGTKPSKRHGYFSLERATLSYGSYLQTSLDELAAMRKSYVKLGRAHKRIGYDLGYPSKLDKLAATIHENATITQAIADLAKAQFRSLQTEETALGGDVSRVKEALRHFVRDWSAEGQKEREIILRPILDVLHEVPADRRESMRVLVPGSGLGRLAWEVSQLGFRTTAIELSYFMTLAFRFLLSPSTTRKSYEHIIHPYSQWFSHQRNNANTFRSVSFPDEVPRLGNRLHLEEGDFLKHTGSGYDFVITLFFIDTSLNVIETVEHIHSLLRPGGKWINLGPLLWPSGAQARLELSLEEMLVLIEATGFDVESGSSATQRRTIVCEYTADPRAMMQWMYNAEFWVASKVQHALLPETD